MAGIKALSYIQVGRETTAGTSCAATAILRDGSGVLEDKMTVAFVEEDIGYLSGQDNTYVPQKEAAISIEQVASFEQLMYPLEAGIKLITTGAADSTGSGKVYTYTLPTTAAPTILTFTIEGGDNQQEEEMEYAFVEKLSISGAAGEAVKVSSDWIGRQVTASTKTNSLTPPVTEKILAQKAVLYVDTSGSTFGTTTVATTLVSWAFNYTTGLHAVYCADGNLYFSTTGQGMPEATLDLEFLHNATAVTAKSDWRSENAKLIRIKVTGSALTTAGNYTAKTLIVDLAGKWDKFEKLTEKDGDNLVKGTFRGRYDPTAQDYGKVVVVNQVAVLP